MGKIVEVRHSIPVPGRIFTRRLTFSVGKNSRKYMMGKSGAFRGELILKKKYPGGEVLTK